MYRAYGAGTREPSFRVLVDPDRLWQTNHVRVLMMAAAAATQAPSAGDGL